MSSDISPTVLSLLLVLGIVVIGSNAFVLSPILADVAGALGTTPVTIARVTSAFGAATALSAFFLAGLIDRFGARRVLLGAALVLTVALAGSAVSPAWQALAMFQAIAGAAAGVMLPAIYTIATATAPDGQGARILSRVLNGWALSLIAGVPISALLTDLLSWRVAYAALAVLSAGAGSSFLALPKPKGPGAAPRAISPARALRIAGVPPLLAVCLCYMAAFYGTYAFIGDHVRGSLDLSAAVASLVVLAYGAGFGLAGLAGALVDRLGPARVFPVILAAVAIVYLVMPWAASSLTGAVLVALIWGLANHYGLNILVLLLSRKDPSARGAILGLHSAVTYTAVFAGPLLLGFLYDGPGFTAVTIAACCLLVIACAIAAVSQRQPLGRWAG